MNLFCGAPIRPRLSLISTTCVEWTISIATIVAAVLLQFASICARIADQKKLFDARIFAQRHDRAGDQIWRTEIAAHGVECDFHRSGNLANSRP